MPAQSVIAGPCAELIYDINDGFVDVPADLNWFSLCGSAEDGTIDKDVCVPAFSTFKLDGTGPALSFCTSGTEPCALMDTKDRCLKLDAMVWSQTLFDPPGDHLTTMRVNCQWNGAACEPTTTTSDPPLDDCGEEMDSSTQMAFVHDRDRCTAADTAGDEFDCVVVSRQHDTHEQKPLCNNIAKHLNACDADYLQYGKNGDRCRANSSDANVAGYPRCTFDVDSLVWVNPYPSLTTSKEPDLAPYKIDLPRPCFSSKCDQVIPLAENVKSFADYATLCIGTGATPTEPGSNSEDIKTTGQEGSVCVPRVTNHNFVNPLENAYCSIQKAPTCDYFKSEDSCHYASLSVFAERDEPTRPIPSDVIPSFDPVYPSCKWEGTACNSFILSQAGPNTCAFRKPNFTAIDDEAKYAAFCAEGGYGCIPRGSRASYFQPNVNLGDQQKPYCIQITEDDVLTMKACSLPMFQEEDFCTKVGDSMRKADSTMPYCHWKSGECLAEVPVSPGDNSCVTEGIHEETYQTYLDHVHHCDGVKVSSGVCLPAEGVYDYDRHQWHDNLLSDVKQCRNYTEVTLTCGILTTKAACEYVDQNVFEYVDENEGPWSIFFGRQCSWDEVVGCIDRSDSCSTFDAVNVNVANYAGLVAQCAQISLSVTTTSPSPGAYPLTRCVPELRSFDANKIARNTCELVNPLNCNSYIAQTEDNCTTADLLFPPKTCQWNVDNETGIGSCSEYETTTCESHEFSVPPTDYKTYYNACSELSGRGYVCLPYVDEDEPGEPVYRCENYQPKQVKCSSFMAGTMSEASCEWADGLVIPFHTDTRTDHMAFLCKWPTTGTDVGKCVDRSAENDCTAVNLDPNATLFAQAEACFENSLTNQPEEADDELCWPLIDDSVGNFINKCDRGRKDGDEVICRYGIFDENDNNCNTANQWGPGQKEDGTPERPKSFFPNLIFCNYLVTSQDEVSQDGCYYDLPSNVTGCAKEVFEEVPASFEEYFDLCQSVQTKNPYSSDKECVPALSKLANDTTADEIKCEAKFGPMTCDKFNNGDTDAAMCYAADEHLFERIDANVYGLSCYPVTLHNKTVCTPRDNSCTAFRYGIPIAKEDTATTVAPDTPNAWKDYNDKCMENTNYMASTIAPAPEKADNVTPLEGLYCTAQIYELQDLQDGKEYNTCTNVDEQNLDCTLPQFQSEDACETMKELQIQKIGSEDTFSLKCKWVPGKDANTPGECKSGMAKLLVPALMVLVSLLW